MLMKKRSTLKTSVLSKGSKVDLAKAGSPLFRTPYEGRFKNPEEAKTVLCAVAFFLRSQKKDQNFSQSEGVLGFAIEKVEVHPSEDIQRVRMETQFASGSVILHVPKLKEESEESFNAREIQILSLFSTSVYEAQMRSAWEFYWSLDEEGKRILVESYKKKEKEA